MRVISVVEITTYSKTSAALSNVQFNLAAVRLTGGGGTLLVLAGIEGPH